MGKLISIDIRQAKERDNLFKEAKEIARQLELTDEKLKTFTEEIDSWSGFPNGNIIFGQDEWFKWPNHRGQEYQNMFIDLIHYLIFMMNDEYWNLDSLLGNTENCYQSDGPDPRVTQEMEVWYDSVNNYLVKYGIGIFADQKLREEALI